MRVSRRHSGQSQFPFLELCNQGAGQWSAAWEKTDRIGVQRPHGRERGPGYPLLGFEDFRDAHHRGGIWVCGIGGGRLLC